MKKSKLIQMKYCRADKDIKDKIYDDYGEQETRVFGYKNSRTVTVYQIYEAYKAAVIENILAVSIFDHNQVINGENQPLFVIFIDKDNEEYATWSPSEEKWYKAKIDNLQFEDYPGKMYGNKPYTSMGTKRIIRDYFDTMEEPRQAILSFQNARLKDNLAKKHRSETDAIDEVMNTVPELPKDFADWLQRSAYSKKRYLFYKKEGKTFKGYCEACGRDVEIKKIRPYHNTKGICPVCHKEITYKAYGKQQVIEDRIRTGIIQKKTDGKGYVLRIFSCRKKIRREYDYQDRNAEGYMYEKYRFWLSDSFYTNDIFEFGEYRCTGVNRWCHELNHGYGYYYEGASTECILYDRNLDKVFKGIPEFTYMPVKTLFQKNKGIYSRTKEILTGLRAHPEYEMLIKCGFTKLVWQIAESEYKREYINIKKDKKPWNMLGLTKGQYEECKKNDAGVKDIRMFQQASAIGKVLSWQQVSAFRAFHCDGDGLQKILSQGHTDKFIRYLRENLHADTEKHAMQDYLDYLKDCEKLCEFHSAHMEKKIEMTLSDYMPKDFQKMHAKIATERAENEQKIKHQEIMAKEKILEKMVPEIMKMYQIEDDNLMIVIPRTKEDFVREGQQQHNCVGGDYFGKMTKGKTIVFFLRKKSEPEKSYCTVEVFKDTIRQCRSACNGDAPKEATDFMKKVMAHYKKEAEKQKKLEKRTKSVRANKDVMMAAAM